MRAHCVALIDRRCKTQVKRLWESDWKKQTKASIGCFAGLCDELLGVGELAPPLDVECASASHADAEPTLERAQRRVRSDDLVDERFTLRDELRQSAVVGELRVARGDFGARNDVDDESRRSPSCNAS